MISQFSTVDDPHLALPASVGYSLVASEYDNWHWSEFWRRNEEPIVLQWISSISPSIGIDVGAGTGPYTFALLDQQKSVVSVDICLPMLQIQRRKLTHFALRDNQTLTMVLADAMALPFAERSANWLLATRVLSNVYNLRRAISEIARVLGPSGSCFISDVHFEHPNRTTTVRLPRREVTIQHFKHSPKSLHDAADSAGLKFAWYKEYRVDDLDWAPPRHSFPRVYDVPGHPIFFCAVLTHSSVNADTNSDSQSKPILS